MNFQSENKAKGFAFKLVIGTLIKRKIIIKKE